MSYAFHLHTQTDNLTNLQCFFHRRRKIKSIYINPKWHIRIRDEILSSCKNGIPDAETIPNLKTVTLFFYINFKKIKQLGDINLRICLDITQSYIQKHLRICSGSNMNSCLLCTLI